MHQPDGLFGVVGAGTGDDRNAPVGDFDADLDDLAMLVMRQRRRLAGGADGNQPGCAFGELPFDERAKGFLVETPALFNGVTSAVSEPLSMSSNSLGLIEFCRSVYRARLLAESEAAHHSLDIVARQALPWCQRAQFERPRQPSIHMLFTT
ncbi:hypothetical protein AJ88_28990 [Mesorhizobium amorphae CCBAU 01583]|nr:hypothetical protein AJ88_28990 [Mesorhizobium amorphae CCBAU 01583]